MNFNQTQFEKRVQRAQKAIAAIAKNLDPEAVTPELIAKVTGFLSGQVQDLSRDLAILERSGVKRGVFSLNAPPADPTPIEPIRITLPGFTLPAIEHPPIAPGGTGATFTPSLPEAVSKDVTVKASDLVGKTAPPSVAKEVLKTAEDAPDRVRVFGDKNAPPAANDDVEFQGEE